jgi:hypothetical protein
LLKGTAKSEDGRTLLLIGLSFGNLDRFRAAPGDTHIVIDGKDMGLPLDVVIFSGETEAQLADMMPLGPATRIHIHGRLKN